MLRLRHKNKGAASLITVIFISIILSIVVIGFVRIAINESRQSTDNDLTARAFYAAESGLEEAKRALREFFRGNISAADLNANSCDVPNGAGFPNGINVLSPPDEFDTEYTCMILDANPPNFEASLGQGETTQVELNYDRSGPTVNTVQVEWHIDDLITNGGDGELGTEVSIRNSADTNLPKDDVWDYPAMLRSYIFRYPTAGNINRSDLTSSARLAFMNPASPSGNSDTINYSSTSGNLGVRNADCDTTNGTYLCRMEYSINNSADNYVLRLTSLYASTHVRVTLFSGNTPVDFEGQQALVDITGRASDVFRRVETRVDISSDFGDLLLDAGILTAEDICKNLSLTDTPGDFSANNCGP